MLNFIFKERFLNQNVFDLFCNFVLFLVAYTWAIMGYPFAWLIIGIVAILATSSFSVWGTNRFG